MALNRCGACGRYTLKQKCPACNAPAERPGPARYSPEDRYGTYRRALKRASKAEGAACEASKEAPGEAPKEAPEESPTEAPSEACKEGSR